MAKKKAETKDAPKLGGCTGKGFMPGKSGNPTGARRYATLSQITKEIGETVLRNGRTKDEQLMETLHRRGCQGNVKAAELYLGYRFGRPVQQNVNLTAELASMDERAQEIREKLAELKRQREPDRVM